jgi:hypothetical protein
MRRTAAIVLLALLAQSAMAAAARDVTLALPHPLQAGEMAWLDVQVGAIGHQQVDVTTASGQRLGTISPFGLRLGQEAGTYTLPVPAEAIRDGRVAIQLTITLPGSPPRAPTGQEVHGVALKITDAAH